MRGKPFEPGDPRAGRKPGSVNKRTVQVRDICRRLLLDPGYQEALQKRLREGKAGSLEPTLWQYAFGAPPIYVSSPLTDMLEELAENGGEPLMP
jgi:hypothetical protein